MGVNTMSYMWRACARQALETLAREGYRNFEVMAQCPHFDPFMERQEALAFGRFLRDAGLSVETINIPSLDQNLASGTPEMREHTVNVFKRLVDIANAHFIGEDAVAGLKAVAPKLGIVHLSDTGREAWRHDPVGQGSCDFAGFGAALKEIHYKKTSMLEIVSGEPLKDIVASHQALVRWGWKALR